jgi:hypothetical protein
MGFVRRFLSRQGKKAGQKIVCSASQVLITDPARIFALGAEVAVY